MHLITKVSTVATLFAASAAFAAVGSQGNIESGKNIYMNGKGDVPACNSCHGQDAMGDDAMGTPRLAGQGYVFLVKQLEDYATDKRMDTTMFIMNTNAKGLSAQDRLDVSAYAASLSKELVSSDMAQVKELGNPVGVRHLGKALVMYGAPDRGISSCYSCHGYNGRGAAPVYPMIGGQKYVYLVSQLKKWRDGSRANDAMGQMQVVAKNLTDEDIYNVSTYLTSAPRTTMGNSRVPGDYPDH
ncbi:MAG: c-type cytochrome [Gammaproteobacteria bacterium]|nr:c-type cytochrome [Gammaproteobacteria bacterium]